MSKRLYFMPLPVRDYLMETLTLSLEARGACSDLLCHLWENKGKPLENSDKTLSKLLRIRPQTWRRIAPEVLSYFEVLDGGITHHGIEEEYRKAAQIHESRVAGGKKTAAKRYGNNDSSAISSATDQKGSSARSIHTHNNNYIKKPLSHTGEKKDPKEPPQGDSDAHHLAEYLHEWILKNNPSAKPETADWAATASAMIEEGRDADEIAFVIEWSQQDDFWKSRALSMANIQKHFDQLALRSGLAEHREAAAREKRRQEPEEERRIEDEVDRAWYDANKEEIDAAAEAAFQKFREESRKLFKKVPE